MSLACKVFEENISALLAVLICESDFTGGFVSTSSH